MKKTLLALLGLTFALAVSTKIDIESKANIPTNQEREKSVMKTIQVLEVVPHDEKPEYIPAEPTPNNQVEFCNPIIEKLPPKIATFILN